MNAQRNPWLLQAIWLGFILVAIAAKALTNVVTSLADSGPGSLRDAISQTETNVGPDVITFATNLSGGVLGLTSGQLVIANQSVAITGAGLSKGIAFDGNGSNRVLAIYPGAALQLDHVTITNGVMSSAGGMGIANAGTLLLSNCLIVSNFAVAGFSGGLLNSATATVVNCTFFRNWGYILGGGVGNIYFEEPGAAPPQLKLINCTFSQNNVAMDQGGAIWNDGGVVIMEHCTIVDNESGFHTRGGSVSITHSLITRNRSRMEQTDVSASEATITSGGWNLIGYAPNAPGLTNGMNNDYIGPFNLGLAPIAYNGGTAPTYLPLSGSRAIDAGNPLLSGAGRTDQRGYPRVANCRVDIGAVEAPARLVTTMTRLDATSARLFWTNGPCIRLQSTTNVADGFWNDVPGSSNGMTVTASNTATFFRLTE